MGSDKMNRETDSVISIAIVDDERPAREGLRYELENILPEAHIVYADSGVAAVRLLTDTDIDLLFLDINLGDVKSTALVPTFQRLQPDMMICFVTAYSDYAVEAFQLEVDDYIMKPFEPERIERVVAKVREQLAQRNEGEPAQIAEGLAKAGAEEEQSIRRLPIHGRDRTIYVDMDKIVYIETYERGCNVYMTGNKYFDPDSIGIIERRLPDLFRIHKSYMVNPVKVSEVFPWGKNNYCLKMEGYPETILPISRDKVKRLREILDR